MGKQTKKQKGTPLSPAAKAFEEGEQAQQRGERRSGVDATRCFEEAVAKFRQALALQPDLSASQRPEALLGLAEGLQQLAERVVGDIQGLPDSLLTPQAEAQARTSASKMYKESIATYQQVTEPDGRMRADACVNCGNALTSLAETLEALTTQPFAQCSDADQQQQQQRQHLCALYRQAIAMYDAALAQEDDALTHSNKGDAQMQLCQALWDSGLQMDAQAAYQAALVSYETSCSMSFSSEGDDLPGLLANWGIGLISAGKCVADPSQRAALYDQAIARLTHCAEFTRGDAAPLISLGDAFVAKAELLAGSVLSPEPATSSSTSCSVPALPSLQGAAKSLHQALSEGYSRALHICRGSVEAQLGYADAHAGLARLAAARGDPTAALQSLQTAITAYEGVLQAPEKVGGFRERCDVRYNASCLLALAGRDSEACSLLQCLLASGGVQRADVASDADLSSRPWVQQLLSS